MVYDLTTELETFLQMHNEPPISLREQMLARKKVKEEEEEAV